MAAEKHHNVIPTNDDIICIKPAVTRAAFTLSETLKNDVT